VKSVIKWLGLIVLRYTPSTRILSFCAQRITDLPFCVLTAKDVCSLYECCGISFINLSKAPRLVCRKKTPIFAPVKVWWFWSAPHVCKITWKVLNEFWWHFSERLGMIQEGSGEILLAVLVQNFYHWGIAFKLRLHCVCLVATLFWSKVSELNLLLGYSVMPCYHYSKAIKVCWQLCYQYAMPWSIVWCSGKALCQMDEVTLHHAWLLLGWVTILVHNLPPMYTQPSTLCGMVKWVSAFGLSSNKWRWGAL